MTHAGSANPNWRGGRGKGGHRGQYVSVFAPDHPAAVKNRVLEHRLVMERTLGRLLGSDEVVHHVNGDTRDNRPENLEVMTQAEHAREHVQHLVSVGYRRPQVVVDHSCERCGAAFTTVRKRTAEQRFCTQACYWEHRREVGGQLQKNGRA